MENRRNKKKFDAMKDQMQTELERMYKAETSLEVLGFKAEGEKVTWHQILARYNRFERMYRPSYYEALQDRDYAMYAADIRREIGRALSQLRAEMNELGEITDDHLEIENPHSVDPDSTALAALFFEDGMTYLRLGDLRTACDMLKRSCETDPTKGLPLAYYAYSVYRRDRNVAGVEEETKRMLAESIRVSPDNSDIYLIVARFHLKCLRVEKAERAIGRARRLDAKNPNIQSVEGTLEKVKKHLGLV